MTAFKKGYDPRRFVPLNTGVTDFYAKVGQLMRQQSLEAVTYIYSVMKDPQAHPKLRYAAAVEILNRGMGKPVDRSIVATIEQGTTLDPSTMSDSELIQMIEQNRGNTNVIEADFTES